ncbi:hypothetical protein EH220_08055 [bacterium]|nr:MAG: hypothetical protein EH220_08055 [bacterium]
MTGVLSDIGSSNLEIVLLKRTFVLPWSQFLFAEGGNDEIRLAFSMHDVVVTGSRLGLILDDLSAQKLSRLQEPARPERFVPVTGPQITSIAVQKVE